MKSKEICIKFAGLVHDLYAQNREFGPAFKKRGQKATNAVAIGMRTNLEKTISTLYELMPHAKWNSWLRKAQDYNDGIQKDIPEKRDYRLVETVDLPNNPKSFALLPEGKLVATSDGSLAIMEKKPGESKYSIATVRNEMLMSGKKIKLLPDGQCAVFSRSGGGGDLMFYGGLDSNEPKLINRLAGEFKGFQVLPKGGLLVWGSEELKLISWDEEKMPVISNLRKELDPGDQILSAHMISDHSIFVMCHRAAGNFIVRIIERPGNEKRKNYVADWLAPFQEVAGEGVYCLATQEGDHGIYLIAEQKTDGSGYGYRYFDPVKILLDYESEPLPAIIDFKILPNGLIVFRTIGNDLYTVDRSAGEVPQKIAESIDEFAVAPDGRIFARSDYKIFIFDGTAV